MLEILQFAMASPWNFVGPLILIAWTADGAERCAWAAPQWLTRLVRDGTLLRAPLPLRMKDSPLGDPLADP